MKRRVTPLPSKQSSIESILTNYTIYTIISSTSLLISIQHPYIPGFVSVIFYHLTTLPLLSPSLSLIQYSQNHLLSNQTSTLNQLLKSLYITFNLHILTPIEFYTRSMLQKMLHSETPIVSLHLHHLIQIQPSLLMIDSVLLDDHFPSYLVYIGKQLKCIFLDYTVFINNQIFSNS